MVKVENGMKVWLVRIASTLMLAWAGWSTAAIIDIKEKSAHTLGHGEEFEEAVHKNLSSIEAKLDEISHKLDQWILEGQN